MTCIFFLFVNYRICLSFNFSLCFLTNVASFFSAVKIKIRQVFDLFDEIVLLKVKVR